jgi:hypothetical protein
MLDPCADLSGSGARGAAFQRRLARLVRPHGTHPRHCASRPHLSARDLSLGVVRCLLIIHNDDRRRCRSTLILGDSTP